MAVPSPEPTKQARRADALARRRDHAAALAPETRAALEAALADRLLPRLVGAGIVAGYHPMKAEPDPYPVLSALGPAQRAALPWFADRDARMMFRAAPATVAGPWGMLQPPADADALAPDVVLVPLVLVDRRGTRIGHGKGHYDRALAHLRAGGHLVRTVGIAWDMQVSGDVLDADPWDVPLDAVVTPSEWIACR